MQRLAALIPRPKLNLIRFYGVLAPNAKLRSKIIPGEKKGKSSPSDANDDAPHSTASVRISWARLLKRVFDIDIEHCSHCGGTLKIIAAILESGAISKILDHLGLPARAHLRKSLILSSQPDPALVPINSLHHGVDLYPWVSFARSAKTRQNLLLFCDN